MHGLTRNERRHGRDEPPPDRRTVCSGHVVGELEGPGLRYLRLGGVEIARRVHMVVRDRNWGTTLPQLSNVSLDAGEQSFKLRFEALNEDRALGVDFSWQGEVVGGSDGSLTLSFDGVANSDMDFNRIGWCVLHPAENAGRRFRTWTAAHLVEEGAFPVEIGPQLFADGSAQPIIAPFERLDVEAADGMWACFEFEGATFEVEDQRNWTDASFKTYSLAATQSFPQRAEAGETIRQVVRITVDGVPVAPAEERADSPAIRLVGQRGQMPAIGVGAASHRVELTSRESELLRAASLRHVRVDVDAAAPDWREALGRAAKEARALGAALEVAVFVPRDHRALDPVARALRAELVPVARVLAFDHEEPTSSARTVEIVRLSLLPELGDVPIIGGTNVFFTDVNRNRPDISDIDGVAWPIAATVHAADDTSVVETAAMHGETVRSGRTFCSNKTIHVTPVTFNARFNPHATRALPEPGPEELPPEVDPRQPSLFAAAWTVSSLRTLAEAGAASLTYFETTGWRGLIEREDGSPAGGRFRSWPGMVFPVYHVLADAASWSGAEVIAVETTDPFAVAAIAARDDRALHVLVASLLPHTQRCRVDGLPAGPATLRVLDEDSFAAACSRPDAFRAASECVAVGDLLELDLAPYATVRIDLVR